MGRVLGAVLILLPIVGVMFVAPLLNAFSPVERIPESEVLAKGWELFSCEQPFAAAFVANPSIVAECKLVEGHKVLVAEDIKPSTLSATKWASEGLAFQFSGNATHQFLGKEISIVIEASCENCNGAVKAVYATGAFGNSDWRDLAFTGTISEQAFSYTVPDAAPARLTGVKPWVVLNPQSKDAKLTIRRILVKAAE